MGKGAKSRDARAAVGFSVHTGWAAVVVVTGPPPQVLVRRKLELADDDYGRFVYHVSAGAPERAAKLIEKSEATARKRAIGFFRELALELPGYLLIVAVPPPKKLLPPLATILKAHPLIHTAEGELFRRSIVEGAEHARLSVETPRSSELPDLGKMGPPWGKDQRAAAALAWAALSAVLSSGRVS